VVSKCLLYFFQTCYVTCLLVTRSIRCSG
jgi:hypothetical protein